MVLDATANFVRGETDASIDGTQTTVSVADASVFPDPATDGEFNVVIWDAASHPRPDQDGDVEVMRVTARDTGTNDLTVTRGQEGTSGASHPSGSAVHLSPTAKMFGDIESTFNAFWDDAASELTADVNNQSVTTDVLGVDSALIDIRDHGAVGDGTTDNEQAIEDALNDADTNGGDVLIPAGDFYYQGLISIDGLSDITIRGVGPQSILRHDDVTTSGISLPNAESVTIKRLRHIGNANTSDKQQGISFTQASKDCLVKECLIEDFGGDGIAWFGADNRNNRAIGNVLINNGENPINPGAGDGTRGGVVRDNLVLDPNSRATNAGIHISENAKDVLVAGNHVEGCPQGINFQDSRRCTVRDNTIIEPGGEGITTIGGTASTCHDNEVVSNTVVGAGTYSVRMNHGENHTIKDNTLIGTDTSETQVSDRAIYTVVAGVSIRDNDIYDMGGYGILYSGGVEARAVISGNAVYGAVSSDEIRIDVTHCSVTGNVLADGLINEASSGDYNRFADNIAPSGVSISGTNSTSGGNIAN